MKQLFSLIFTLISCISFAQENEMIIENFLINHHDEIEVDLKSISKDNWIIYDHTVSKQTNIEHLYIRQLCEHIEIVNAVANFTLKDKKVVACGNRLLANIAKPNRTEPIDSPVEALENLLTELGVQNVGGLELSEISAHHYQVNDLRLSDETVNIKLVYFPLDHELRLSWEISILTKDASHWWSAVVEDQTGEIHQLNDWILSCDFGSHSSSDCKHHFNDYIPQPEHTLAPDQYTVFALPVESPIHGNRSVVTNPADSIASPFGWHDVNGINGAEYTITRGNNVYAYDDVNDSNNPGFSPDGGSVLEFNFPYNGANAPSTYQAASITNLFYMNNMMHDIWYHYGFDENNGNFQDNNYGNGGTGNDYVLAEAQDGGGTNNANFATPPDGSNPRMQMYLWNSSGSSGGNYLDVNSPSVISGSYAATDASFGPGLPATPITADVVLVIDNTAPVNDGCETIINAAQLSGKIAIIDRGACTFVNKVAAAENAGALAVIIVNNVAGSPIQMGGTSNTINIPSIMISQTDGNAIKNELQNGPVNATISNGGGATNSQKDGDLDNGIIAHEYGHGISNRLSGGPSNANCLSNSEQMGEGWSDWFGLMLTIEPGDLGGDIRGIGTYAVNQNTNGTGIRPAPYSTDFNVNSYTYAASNNTAQISEPHGVGFIFATVLWDMTWALIDQYGGIPDPDLLYGTGGNNIAMHLVIEALKIQPCNPGMIDGRDAILQADMLLYNGIHECLIWDVFANRGFGYSASQGSANSRTDQTEAFDLPPQCMAPTIPPSAAFFASAYTSCVPTINFTDSSYNIPQQWLWDFGDGTTDTLRNPVHTFPSSGTYNVQLTVSNTMGSDSISLTITIALPPTPIVNDVVLCAGDTTLLIANSTGISQWYDDNNVYLQTGDTLSLFNVNQNAQYLVENLIESPSTYGGAANTGIGGGGYHSSGYHGALNFTAVKSFEIVSALVDASGAGPRTITLASGTNNDGTSPGNGIESRTFNLVNGTQRINLNMIVPAAGNFNIGGNNVDLFRNNSGANYPYNIPGFMSINNSSATTNPTGYYYYLYDIEVRDLSCYSALDTVNVSVIESNFSYSANANTLNFTDLSTGATSWYWDFGDGNFSTQQNPVHSYLNPGNYTISLSINGQCSSTQTFDLIVSNIHQKTVENIIVAPNPTDNLIRIITDGNLIGMNIFLMDMNGKVLYDRKIDRSTQSIDVSLQDFPSAVYLLKLYNSNEVQSIKVIKK